MDEDEDVIVELDSAVGPRVLVADGLSPADAEAALPEGWQVDWETPGVRTDSGRWSHPLCRA
jgi:hypothetical protein